MNRPATTLTELLLVLTLLGILLFLAVPSARGSLDAIAVRSARESVFAIAMRARSLAMARAGADFVIDIPARTALAIAGDGAVADRASVASYHVNILADGTSADRVILHYDAYGIGRMASRTIRFRRGGKETGLTFSSFGRIRRW